MSNTACKFYIALLVLAGFFMVMVTDFRSRLDDDLLYTYTIAQALAAPDAYQREIANARKFIEEQKGAGEENLIRFDFRNNYKNNYLLPTIALALSRSVFLDDEYKDLKRYLKNIAEMTAASLLVGNLIVILGFLLIVIRTSDRLILWSLLIALSLNFLFVLLNMMEMVSPSHYRFAQYDFVEFVARGVKFLFLPGLGYDINGLSPRSLFSLLLLGAFLLRFQKKYRVAYLLCLLMCLIHVTYAIFAVAFFVIIDAALNPSVLRRGSTILPILLVSVIGTLQSAVWTSIGSEFSMFALMPVIILGLAWIAPLMDWGRRFVRFDRVPAAMSIEAETALVLLGTILICLVSYASFKLAGQSLNHIYTTAELAPRVTGMMRMVIIFGGVYAVCRLLQDRMPPGLPRAGHRLLAIFVMLACVLSVTLAMNKSFEPFINTRDQIEAHTYKLCPEAYVEPVMYSFMSCRIDGLCEGKEWNMFDKCRK